MLALAALFLPLTPAAARAEHCGKRAEVIAHLERMFGEVPVAAGLAFDGSVFEIVASATGSWTLLISLPNGISCVAAAGEAWTEPPPRVSGRDA